MANIFAGSEIVELGVRIEENGRDFYRTSLKQSKSEKAAESYPGEYFAYMKALSKEYVFTQKGKGSQVAKNVKSDKEAVDLGIGFEKDSIAFYEGMKKVVPQYDHKVVDQVIEQEKNHLQQLTELKNSL